VPPPQSFILFDDAAEFVVHEDVLHYRHKISPYMGEHLRGVVRATYLRGECVFENGTFAATPHGREYEGTAR
jgi:allantoinase